MCERRLERGDVAFCGRAARMRLVGDRQQLKQARIATDPVRGMLAEEGGGLIEDLSRLDSVEGPNPS
jgi:hypothetical protein